MRAFIKRDQEGRHRREADRRQLVAWCDVHDRRADGEIEQILSHRQIKLRLTQNPEQLFGVGIERNLRLHLLVGRDLLARHQAAPLALRREERRLHLVGEGDGGVDPGAVEHLVHLAAARDVALPVAVIKVPLREEIFVTLLVDSAPLFLMRICRLGSGPDLIGCGFHFGAPIKLLKVCFSICIFFTKKMRPTGYPRPSPEGGAETGTGSCALSRTPIIFDIYF